MIIGITGRGGSGKTYLSNKILERYKNFSYINVDNIVETRVLKSKRLLSEINEYFKDKEYSINDVIMAYFKKNEKNNIIHAFFLKEVVLQINNEIKNLDNKDIIIDWFLLHEIFEYLPLDVTIMTYADDSERLERVRRREQGKESEMFIMVDNSFVSVDESKIDYKINTSNNFEGLIYKIIEDRVLKK